MLLVKNTFPESYGNAANVSICVRAGLPKPRPVPDTERTKDTKTLDYASTPLDANTLLHARARQPLLFCQRLVSSRPKHFVDAFDST
jgi:hypothetical protein